MEKLITIITPTFNRAHTLERCYQSLINQTSDDFLWLIIDDGSKDDTEKLVRNFQKNSMINIKYIKKENGGKASALNVAFNVLKTKYWVCLDSDDTLSTNAVKDALSILNEIKDNNKFCGFLALRNNIDGSVMGNKRIPSEVKYTTTLELWNKYKIRSEYIEFYKTDITKNYRFPEINGEKFITPEYLAHLLNVDYHFKVSQKTYCYCEYLSDGLTNNKNSVIKKNPKGYTLIMLSGLNNSIGLKAKCLWCLKFISGLMLVDNKMSFLKKTPHKLMTIFLFPLGWMIYFIRFR